MEQILSDIVVVLVVASIIFLGVLLISNWVFLNQFREDVLKLKNITEETNQETKRPAIVERYLERVNAEQELNYKQAFVTHIGFCRLKTDQKWTPVKGEQFFRTDEPSFTWMAFLKINPVVRMNTIEKRLANEASIVTRLWSFLPVTKQGGPKVSQSLGLRYLSEIPWFPQAIIHNSSITWAEVDERHVKATLRNGSEEDTVIYTFNEDGLIEKMTSEGRYRNDEKEKWSVHYTGYQTIHGVTVPYQTDSFWHLAEGDFHYGRIHLKTVHYE
ncbi:DUF6544 family protein [Alteribacter populi]|uniref:DUF6544 family protein n=1 Tax=Alteribacter populi TaxID=2011011 RepID=UPI000BBB0C41|nr:DUF6544 family protein [Alteribacter populi]